MSGAGDIGKPKDVQEAGEQEQARHTLSDEGRQRLEALRLRRTLEDMLGKQTVAPKESPLLTTVDTGSRTGESARTYFGVGDNLVPKESDGYLEFERVAGSVVGPLGRTYNYPGSIRLNDGSTLRTKVHEGDLYGTRREVLFVTGGKDSFLAIPTGRGGLDFYERSPYKDASVNLGSSDPGRDILFKGGIWIPFSGGIKERKVQKALIYQEAYRVSNGGEERESPQVEQEAQEARREARHRAEMDRLQRKIDDTEKSVKEHTEARKTSIALLEADMEQIEAAVQKGYITLDTDSESLITLMLSPAKGIRKKEWNKIRDKYEENLANREASLQQWLGSYALHTDIINRETGELYDDLANSETYVRHLGQLAPEERAIEVSRIAQILADTPAGGEFARDWLAALDTWRLKPASRMMEMFVGEPPTSPRGRMALAGMALALAPHLGESSESALANAFEIVVGRSTNSREWRGICELVNVESPKAYSKLLASGGDASTVLVGLARATEGSRLGNRAEALGRAGSYVALFRLAHSTFHLAKKGISFETTSNVMVDATRAWGTWAAISEKARGTGDWLVKYGKVAGHASSIAGLVFDLSKVAQQSSDEGKYRAWVHAAASGVIVAGSAVGTPVAVGAAATAFIVKLFYDRTSHAYESMHRTLKYSLY